MQTMHCNTCKCASICNTEVQSYCHTAIDFRSASSPKDCVFYQGVVFLRCHRYNQATKQLLCSSVSPIFITLCVDKNSLRKFTVVKSWLFKCT